MSYAIIGSVANSPNFQHRVDYAMMVAAINVAAEGAVANHATRLAYAQKIFDGSYQVQRAVYAILTNASIAAEANETDSNNGIPDGDIQFAANSVFNALAGIG